MEKKREIEFDILRIIAMLAVIITHVCVSQIHDLSVKSSDFIWLNIIRAAVTWDVPIFVMISGRFFLDPEKLFTLKKLYQKYIKRLVCAFCIWSAIYVVYNLIWGYWAENSIRIIWKECIFQFCTGPYHMWYVFMIVGLYIASPILRKIATDKKLMEYFIILFLIVQCAYQYAVRVPVIDELTTAVMSKTYFYITLGYSGYFVLGYYLYRYGIPKKMERCLLAVTFLLIIFSCIGTTIQSLNEGTLNEFISTYQTPNVIIESCGIYIWGITRFSKVKVSELTKKIINTLGNWGLGIYLCHALILEILCKTGITPTFITPVFGVSIMTVCVFMMSVLVIFCISKIPILKRNMM